jgi:hypothetical protein
MATIGIRQRIPLNLFEMALRAVLSGEYSRKYFEELAAMEYNGPNRIVKSVCIIAKLTEKNPLIDFLREHSEEVSEALRYKSDRGLILSSLLISTYEFVYDMICLYGKYFHVQDQVTTSLVSGKLAEKYGSNRSLPNAMNSAIPMLLEAGILKRPTIGVYEICKASPTTEIAREIYDKAFLHWNPNCDEDNIPSTHPYYEFIN